MPYAIDYLPSATKAIERLPRDVQARVLNRVERLADVPRAAGTIKLAGEDVYRVRVGDYRILFTIDDGRLIVLVVDVGHRGDVYRRR